MLKCSHHSKISCISSNSINSTTGSRRCNGSHNLRLRCRTNNMPLRRSRSSLRLRRHRSLDRSFNNSRSSRSFNTSRKPNLRSRANRSHLLGLKLKPTSKLNLHANLRPSSRHLSLRYNRSLPNSSSSLQLTSKCSL